MTSSFEFPVHPVPPVHPALRLSDADRDRVLVQLREGAAEGKLSHDTFMRRMELALVARRSEDLAVLTADLAARPGEVAVPYRPYGDRSPHGEHGSWTGRLFGWVGRLSAVGVGVRRAWHAERLPKLLLPMAGGETLKIGRDPGNGLRLSHETVSRSHAELSLRDGLWVLRDLGSTNGTTVNGRRVLGSAVVRAGDQVAFGRMAFRLAAS
ncbi:FHA domain-containing protein [Streptomyces venezuelae]|uniref:FHA domain-containing protein n=1 Tax=Streptomyces venezuelae TaxID=54571 RepID=UPI0039897563